MEKKTNRPLTPFDELTVPPELQMLKLLLPYTPASSQKSLGILIKFLELQHTIQFFQHFTVKLHSQTLNGDSPSLTGVLEEITPYLPENEQSMLSTFRDVMNMMEMVQMFQTTSNTDSDNSSGTFNPKDLIMGMLSPEQQEMFQTYQNIFEQEGDATHERMDEQSSSEKYRSDEVRTNSDGSGKDSREIRTGDDAHHDGADNGSK